MPELRRDPVIGRWVIIATERAKRPSDYNVDPEPERGKLCPFCPGEESKTPSEVLAYAPPGRKKNEPGWWLRVVPNKFPALKVEGSRNRHGDGMYDLMDGIGAHEVLIESPDHTKEVSELPLQAVEDIFWAFRDRIIDLRQDARFEYILVFKNKGAAAGASLAHPHSQLIATPMVPVRVEQEMSGALDYYEYKERCVYCDMILQELAQNKRIIAQNDFFIAFEPYAPRFPFETWLLPKHHESHFEDISKHDVTSLSSIMKEVLGKLKVALDDPAFNFSIHNSPLKSQPLPHYHWHIEIIPKLYKVAGFEWGTGFYINPTPPEEAAQFLNHTQLSPKEA